MDRAFSAPLTLKTISSAERIVEGVASTPTVDRMGDIVEPLGATFNLPLPFLLDHDSTQAIGNVEAAKATAAGITFRARVAKIDTPGRAKDLVDYAWDILSAGLRKTVSIGFRPIEYSQIDGGGLRFTAWEWFELSAVSVPAQPDAIVTSLKSARLVARGLATAQQGRRIVRLSAGDINRGKLLAAVAERTERRNRLGIPSPIVKL